MPTLGETKRARDIGLTNRNPHRLYIWYACTDCGKERWVRVEHGEPSRVRCIKCHNVSQKGAGHNNWKGGRTSVSGYITIWISPDDFFFPMADKGRHILEHRLVM